MDTITLSTVIGAKAWRERIETAAASVPGLALNFTTIAPIYKSFAPMAREQKFDVSEMAVTTALQAVAYNKPVIMLPVTVAARFQQRCIIARKDEGLTPGTIRGKRVAVRAYTQTTGVWLRGILQNDYGVPAEAIRWVTQEGAHVAEYSDPAWVERAPEGRSLVDMLRDGFVDAAILGNDLPDDPAFVPVIADPDAAAKAWHEKHGIVPINHMIVMRKDLATSQPDALRRLWQAIVAAEPAPKDGLRMTAAGIEPNRKAIDILLTYCEQQKLLPRKLTVDEIFADAKKVLDLK